MICTEISAADVPLAKNYQLMFGLHRIMSLSWFAQNYPQMYSLACIMFSQQRTATAKGHCRRKLALQRVNNIYKETL